MKTFAAIATLVLMAGPAAAQVNPSAETPATGTRSTGGNVSQPAKPVPNAGSTAGGPTSRGGGYGGPTGTLATPGAAAPERAAPDASAASNARQPAKPVPNTGTVSGGPAAATGK